MTDKPESPETESYRDAVVVDGLNVSNWDSPAVYESLRRGGVSAINATIAVWEDFPQTVDNIAAWMARFRTHEESLTPVTSVRDILDAKEQGKTGVVFGWQNASPLGGDLNRLELFHRLGVRIVQITYNERNLVGNGCYERSDDGLSHFGVDAVKELNRLGILIDLSHVGDRTTLEAAELSEQPVACTHANARGFFNHVRNKTDDALRLIADGGGVIGANAFPPFLRNGFESTVADYVDAIDDLVERIGVDHVAIGTDYTQDQPKAFFDWIFARQGTKIIPASADYPDPLLHPAGMETPDKLGSVAGELERRGYGATDVVKVLGGNWLRLFGEVLYLRYGRGRSFHSCILGMDVADRFILGQIRPWLSKIATSQAPRARTVVCPDASAGRKGECCKTGPERSIQVPKRRCSYS